jgi:hypothetical protein
MRKALIAIVAALALAGAANAQNAPLSGLSPRGAVQATDIIPIMPAGGTQLMQTTVGAIISPATAGAAGTVQSVNLTLPGAFSCTGGPITTSGRIACTLGNESANSFLAGPASGSAAPATFRAIQIADLCGGAGAGASSTTARRLHLGGRFRRLGEQRGPQPAQHLHHLGLPGDRDGNAYRRAGQRNRELPPRRPERL